MRLRTNRLALILTLALAAAGAGSWFLYGRYGTIRLNPTERAQLSSAAPCTREPRAQRMDCYRKALTDRVDRDGVAAAVATLEILANVDPDVYRDGHVYAHGIGIEGYLHFKSVPETFGACPVEFASGCGHGVIQAYLESQSTVDSTSLNRLCGPYRDPAAGRWQLFQCVHGTGHGLNMMYRGDLPRALGACNFLDIAWDREACYGGVFMENIMSEIAPHHPATELASAHEHSSRPAFKRLDPAEPLYPCSIMEAKYLRACYDIQTSAMLHYAKGNITKVARECDAAPLDWRPACHKSLGRDISSKARRDPRRTRRYCDQGDARYRPWCYLGAVKALIDWRASPADGLEFCRGLGDAPGWALCYQGVGEQVNSLAGPEGEREKLCAAAGRPVRVEACRYGAVLPGTMPPKDDSAPVPSTSARRGLSRW